MKLVIVKMKYIIKFTVHIGTMEEQNQNEQNQNEQNQNEQNINRFNEADLLDQWVQLPPRPVGAPVRYQEPQVNPADVQKINNWVEQCRQKHGTTVQMQPYGLIRQFSGPGVQYQRPDGTIGYDANDYGAYITNCKKDYNTIFDTYQEIFALDRDTLDRDTLDRDAQLLSLLEQIDTDHIKTAITFCRLGKFCEMWKVLNIASVYISSPDVLQSIRQAKTLAASIILSIEHTKMITDQISNKLIQLEEYTVRYLLEKPRFQTRAWNLNQYCFENIQELSHLERNFHENRSWVQLYETLPRSRPSKSANVPKPMDE